MMGFRVARRAIVLAAASLPAVAFAGQSSGTQANTAAPQTIPGLDNFSIPSSRPLATPTPSLTPSASIVPTPSATPTFKRIQPAPTPTATRTPSSQQYGADAIGGVVNVVTRWTITGTPTVAPATPSPTPNPTASASPTPTAAPPVAEPSPVATATPAPMEQPSSGVSPGLIAAAAIALLLLAGAAFTFLRRRRTIDDYVAAEPLAPAAAPPPPVPAPVAPPGAPAPRVTARTIDEARPEIEITLIPKRAGTNLTSAAVDYQVVLRNAGSVAARDIRFGIYMLSASATQASDLQTIFAATVDQPALPPFELAAGCDVQLSGMALLPRENLNVMTIDGKPWFVPVLAMKAEYRWGENAGAPGVATAAHMIGIDRGEGVKMAPFRLDTGPHMHPGVGHRRVA